MGKSSKFLWIFLGFTMAVAIFLMRHAILLFSLSTFLNYTLPEGYSVTISSVRLEGLKVVAENLLINAPSFHAEVQAARLQEGKLFLSQSTWHLSPRGECASLLFWDRLVLDQATLYTPYGDFSGSFDRGKLTLFPLHSPEPLLTAQLQRDGDLICYSGELLSTALERFIPQHKVSGVVSGKFQGKSPEKAFSLTEMTATLSLRDAGYDAIRDVNGEIVLTGSLQGNCTLSGNFEKANVKTPLLLTGSGNGKRADLHLLFPEREEVMLLIAIQEGMIELTAQNFSCSELKLLQHLASYRFADVADVEFYDGDVSAHIALQLNDGKIQTIDVLDLKGDGIGFEWPKKNAHAFFEELTLRLCIQDQTLFSCFATAEFGEISYEKISMSDLAFSIEKKDGVWTPSEVKGSLLGMEGIISWSNEEELDLELTTSVEHLFSLLSEEELIEKTPLEISATLSLDEMTLSGEGKFAGECVKFGGQWGGEYWFSSSHMDLAHIKPLLETVDVEGSVSFFGTYDQEKILIEAEGRELSIRRGDLEGFMPHLPCATFRYDLEEKLWQAHIALKDALVQSKARKAQSLAGTLHLRSDLNALWALECTLEEGELFWDQLHLEKVSMHLKASPEKWNCEDLSAHLVLPGGRYHLQEGYLAFADESGRFSLSLKNCLSLAGTFQLQEDASCALVFDAEKSLFQGELIGLREMVLSSDGAIKSLQLRPKFPAEKLPDLMHFLHDAGLSAYEIPAYFPLRGMLQGEIDVSDGGSIVNWKIAATSLFCRKSPLPRMLCVGKKTQGAWNISKLEVGDSAFRFCLEEKKGELSIPLIEGKFPTLAFMGKASILQGTPWKILTEGTLDMAGRKLKVATERPMRLHGLSLQGIELIFNDSAKLTMADILYDVQEECIKGSKAHLYAPASFSSYLPKSWQEMLLWDKPLKAEGIWQWGREGFSFLGKIGQQSLLIAKEKLVMKNLSCSYCDKSLQISGDSSLYEAPFSFSLHASPKDLWRGSFVLQTPSSPGMNGSFTQEGVEKLQGELWGISVDLKKKAPGIYTGSLSGDLSRAHHLFPPFLQLGSGYSLVGTFTLAPFHFSGTLKGEEFCLFGYQIKALSSAVEFSEEEISLRNLCVKDFAGALTAPLLELHKRDAHWDLSLASLNVQSFTPSKLRAVSGKSAIKPLVISHLQFKEVKGTLGDPSSFTGFGSLQFTNREVITPSLFDTPREWIRDVGLDPSVLMPVQGELQLLVENGLLHIPEIHHVYSEGKRASLSLDEESASYIDFHGGLFINLKLTQDSLLKLAEPYTLTIRGSLEKPRYGLR